MWRLRRLFEIQPQISLLICVPPPVTMAMLESAMRPSVERLYLRDAFAEGRRYALQQTARGFRMTTTSKQFWQRRTRTAETCLLDAMISPAAENTQTALIVSARMRWLALVTSLWIPVGMAFLIWNMPWPRSVIVVILSTLFVLAVASVRLTCSLEAAEMTFFIRKTFENVQQSTPFSLSAPTNSVVVGAEYDALWERLQSPDAPESQ